MITSSILKEHLRYNIWGVDLESFQVVIDFDGTATKFDSNIERSNTIIGQIRNSNILGSEYSQESEKLFRYYNDISLNSEIPDEAKSLFMTWWWQSHLKLFSRYWLDQTKLDRIVATQSLLYRDWFFSFLEFLAEKEVPITIFSWASTRLIQSFLKKDGVYYDNINIISNELYPTDLVINTFNKSRINLSEVSASIRLFYDRKNVLLLWDSLQDSFMAESLNYTNIFKIAFIRNLKERDEYWSYFDLLLGDDFDYSILTDSLRGLFNIS